ncbi:hypothetical protein SKAU_G00299010, partial [Synaphobranchus kaupii]
MNFLINLNSKHCTLTLRKTQSNTRTYTNTPKLLAGSINFKKIIQRTPINKEQERNEKNWFKPAFTEMEVLILKTTTKTTRDEDHLKKRLVTITAVTFPREMVIVYTECRSITRGVFK